MKRSIKMTPGDDLHLSLLMAPHNLNLAVGPLREQLLGYGRAAFEAGKAGQCVHQIQEPDADIWPCINIDVDERGNVTNAKLYSPGLPAGNHDVYPVRVPYMDEHTEAWLACSAELHKAAPEAMHHPDMSGIECAVAAIKSLAAQKAAIDAQVNMDEMAMLVRKLVQQLRKAAPDNDSGEKALDFLKRHGLSGTLLRGNSGCAPENVPSELKLHKASGAFGTPICTPSPKRVPTQKRNPQPQDCQRPECMSRGCFGHCIKVSK